MARTAIFRTPSPGAPPGRLGTANGARNLGGGGKMGTLFSPFAMCLLASMIQTAYAKSDNAELSDNLFSDLAPILSLFGEQVTKQFMSGSLGVSDSIILAVVPLGIITIVVSAIRIGGPEWLRAIVGRARENRPAAEVELTTSTSVDVCEMWNGRAIVRLIGAPKILELLYFHDTRINPDLKDNYGLFTIETAVKAGLLKQCPPKRKNWGASMFAPRTSAKKNIPPYPTDEEAATSPEKLGPKQPSTSTASGQPGNAEPLKNSNDGNSSSARDDALPRASGEGASAKGGGSGSGQPSTSTTTEQNLNGAVETSNWDNSNFSPSPNIYLNIQRERNAAELRSFAVFGMLLQLGLLVFFGVVSYHGRTKRAVKTEEGDTTSYGFPLAAIGTLLLVVGGFVCSTVVEASTRETYWQSETPFRIVWIQQGAAVNDQTFDSYAIISDIPRTQIMRSTIVARRDGRAALQTEASNFTEVVVVVATFLTLAGFISQFTGLRSMHWTTSITQLAAVIIMAGIRAFVRRGMATSVVAQKLRPGHELDWLATRIVNDHDKLFGTYVEDQKQELPSEAASEKAWSRFMPRRKRGATESHLRSLSPEGDSEFWNSECWKWGITTPTDCSSFELHGSNTNNSTWADVANNQTNNVMECRVHVGHLSKWVTPTSDSAIAATRAIDTIVNLLELTPEASEYRWLKWCLRGMDGDRVFLTLRRIGIETGRPRWQSSASEVAALLSLWMYTISEDSEGGDLPQSNINRSEFDWLQNGHERSRIQRYRVFGPKRDEHNNFDTYSLGLEWYLPFGVPSVSGNASSAAQGSDTDNTPEMQNMAGQALRSSRTLLNLVGFTVGSQSPTPSVVFDTYYVTHYDGSLPRLLAQQLFSAVIWAFCSNAGTLKLSARIRDDPTEIDYIDDETEDLPSVETGPRYLRFGVRDNRHEVSLFSNVASIKRSARGDSSSKLKKLQNFRLKSSRISNMVDKIQAVGSDIFDTREEIYLGILTPLSWLDRLPLAQCLLDRILRDADEYETNGLWEHASTLHMEILRLNFLDKGFAIKIACRVLAFRKEVYRVYSLFNYRKRIVSEKYYHLAKELGELKGYKGGLLETLFLWNVNTDRDYFISEYSAKIDRRVENLLNRTDYFPMNKIDPAFPTSEREQNILQKEMPVRCIIKLLYMGSEFGSHFEWRSPSSTFRGSSQNQRLGGNQVDSGILDHFSANHEHRRYITGEGSRSGVYLDREMVRDNDWLRMMDEKDSLGRTPLHYAAAFERHMEGSIADVMSENSVSTLAITEDIDGFTPLHYAQDPKLARYLLDIGQAKINSKGRGGLTALHLAVQARQETHAHAHELVDLLIQSGADIEAKDNIGMSPLHYAAYRGNAKFISLLMSKHPGGPGMARTARDKFGRLPHHLAIVSRKLDSYVYDALALTFEDVLLKDKRRWSALEYAARLEDEICLKLLCRRLSNSIDDKNIFRYKWEVRDILETAVLHCGPATIGVLLEVAGSMQDELQPTVPLTGLLAEVVCIGNSNYNPNDIIDLLVEKGADKNEWLGIVKGTSESEPKRTHLEGILKGTRKQPGFAERFLHIVKEGVNEHVRQIYHEVEARPKNVEYAKFPFAISDWTSDDIPDNLSYPQGSEISEADPSEEKEINSPDEKEEPVLSNDTGAGISEHSESRNWGGELADFFDDDGECNNPLDPVFGESEDFAGDNSEDEDTDSENEIEGQEPIDATVGSGVSAHSAGDSSEDKYVASEELEATHSRGSGASENSSGGSSAGEDTGSERSEAVDATGPGVPEHSDNETSEDEDTGSRVERDETDPIDAAGSGVSDYSDNAPSEDELEHASSPTEKVEPNPTDAAAGASIPNQQSNH